MGVGWAGGRGGGAGGGARGGGGGAGGGGAGLGWVELGWVGRCAVRCGVCCGVVCGRGFFIKTNIVVFEPKDRSKEAKPKPSQANPNRNTAKPARNRQPTEAKWNPRETLPPKSGLSQRQANAKRTPSQELRLFSGLVTGLKPHIMEPVTGWLTDVVRCGVVRRGVA